MHSASGLACLDEGVKSGSVRQCGDDRWAVFVVRFGVGKWVSNGLMNRLG